MNKITVETPYGTTVEYYHYQGVYYPCLLTGTLSVYNILSGVAREPERHVYSAGPADLYDACITRAERVQLMPEMPDMQQLIESAKTIEIRDDDVFLATYEKAGTHWAWEIMMMLKKGSVNYETKPKEYMFLEMRSPEQLAEVPSPRVLNSHYPVKHLPLGLFEKKTKIIHVQRNPKSIFVSSYHFVKCFTDLETECFSRFLPFLMGTYGIYYVYPWFEYVKEFERFTKDNPDQILNIYYEDMEEDPVREIKKMNEFLQCGRSNDIIEQIAEACSFQNMKKADTEVKDHSHIWPPEVHEGMKSGAIKMYRKGDVADWKNYFTVAQNEKMDAWLKENLAGSDLKYRYEL